MKKLLALLLVAAIAITSVFAIDLNIAVDPWHNYDATATVMVRLGFIEVGGGAYTNAVSKLIASMVDEENTAEFKDKAIEAFTTAEYGATVQAYIDVINSDSLKLALGAIADVGSIQDVKDKITEKHIYFNALASAKATVMLGNVGVFVQAGVPVATVDFNNSEEPVDFLFEFGFDDATWTYVKDNARISIGATLAL